MDTTDTTERCPICGKAYYTGGGRSLNLSDEQIIAILEHCKAPLPKHTIKHFCESIGISPYTYRLVVSVRLKKQTDILRVVRLKAELDSKGVI